MNKCMKCNVEILDNTQTCPLCHHVLSRQGEEGVNTYPDARVAVRKFRFTENLLLFLSIVAESVLIYIYHLTGDGINWSLIVGLALIYANVVMQLAIVGKSGYVFKTLSLVVLAVVSLFGIDYLTGYHKWSLEISFPIAVLLLDLAILILMVVNRRNWQSYMMVQIFTILLSMIPIVLLVAGVIEFPYLAVIASGVSIFIFLGTLILGDQRARSELMRRFHW